MKTVAQLAASDAPEHAWLFVIAGVPFALTTRHELAGEGDGSWIGTDYGPRRVVEGLQPPSTLTFATVPQDGRPDTDDGIELVLTDFSREIIQFMREKYGESTAVFTNLTAGEDPAPAVVETVPPGETPLWGKWINGEAIGPAGERAYFPIFPTGDIPGEHISIEGKSTIGLSYLYDEPTMFEGLRCALYMLFQDPETGTWPSWEDHYTSGESLKWVGTLTNQGEADSTEWKISADGPSSMLRKQIGRAHPEEWLPFPPNNNTTLSDQEGAREDLFALSFGYRGSAEPVLERAGSTEFDTVTDTLPSGTAEDMIGAIVARAAVVATEAGPDIASWVGERNAEFSLEIDGEKVRAGTRMDDKHPSDIWAFTAFWTVTAHIKVWAAMGFDPINQNAQTYQDETEIKFVPAEKVPNLSEPGPGYYQATFWTVPVGFATAFDAASQADNDGEWRYHTASYAPNPVQLSADAGDVLTVESIDLIGKEQTNRPPGDRPGFEYESQGYIAIQGSYRASQDAEVKRRAIVAKVNWSYVLGFQYATIWAERYVDSRFYQCDSPPIKQTWVSNDAEWSWVNVLGYNLNKPDRAIGVLLNLMLSSGTAYWTGVEGSATLTNGINAHPSMPASLKVYNDTERQDLGLQIPHSLINLPSFTQTEKDFGFGYNDKLARCKYAWFGETDSQEIIARILEQRGWGLGFNRGKWRLFNRPVLLTDDDVEVVIGPDDIASDDPAFKEQTDRRPLMPRESITLDMSYALVSDAASELDLNVKHTAGDPGARTRRDNGTSTIDGWGLASEKLFPEQKPLPEWQWDPEFWYTCDNLFRWFNQPNLKITLPIRRTKARLLGPGSVVRVTTLYAANQEGGYGLTGKLGRVYKVVYDTETMAANVSIMVQPGSSDPVRRFAPLAVVKQMFDALEERHDASSRTFFVEKNGMGHANDDLHDCTYFEEPSYMVTGGNAIVWGYQHDGRTWTKNFEFEVESVSTLSDSITYKAGTLSGVFKEAQYTLLILAPWDEQPVDSWPRALFSVLTKSDNTFGVGPTQGFKLV